MKNLLHKLFAKYLRNERGAATAEYALLLALVVIILIGTLSTLGGELNLRLNEIITNLQNAGR
jgi:pilus assembly protein Flp/PilA